MQPPPRKGNSLKFLKSLHAEQIAKLQVKNHTECELLDDLRNFLLKKSALEKSAAEALLKITSVYLNKKITTNIPDFSSEGGEEKWNMWSVWRTILEENEKLAKSRLAAIEIYQQKIIDDAKLVRAQKIQANKKYIDQLCAIQKDIQATVHTLEKSRKLYAQEEYHYSDDNNTSSVSKRKKGLFFTSLSKGSGKGSIKKDGKDGGVMTESVHCMNTRAEYLMNLAAANAHQTRYFTQDLQYIVQAMENGVYEKVREYFELLGTVELLNCSAQEASYDLARKQALQLSREYNLQCLYSVGYKALKQHVQHDFEPAKGDSTTPPITIRGPPNDALIDDTRFYCTNVLTQKEIIAKATKQVQIYKATLIENETTCEQQTELEAKIESLESEIRRAHMIKVKDEARIAALKNGDDSIREMVEKIEKEVLIEGKSWCDSAAYSSQSVDSQSGAVVSSYEVDDEEPQFKHHTPASVDYSGSRERQITESWDDGDAAQTASQWGDAPAAAASWADTSEAASGWGDDGVQPHAEKWNAFGESSASGGGKSVSWKSTDSMVSATKTTIAAPAYIQDATSFKCCVLYSYTAMNPDELNLESGEEIEIIGENGDGDGWLMARNLRGEEGFVPATYLDAFTQQLMGVEGGESGESATSDADTETAVAQVDPEPEQPSAISFSSVDYTIQEDNSTTSSTDKSPTTSIVTVKEQDVTGTGTGTVTEEIVCYCKAMYEYEASADDEIALLNGQLLAVLQKCAHDDDDSWWRGYALDDPSKVGCFPALLVAECDQYGQLLSPDDAFEEDDDDFGDDFSDEGETEPPPMDAPVSTVPPSLPPPPPPAPESPNIRIIEINGKEPSFDEDLDTEEDMETLPESSPIDELSVHYPHDVHEATILEEDEEDEESPTTDTTGEAPHLHAYQLQKLEHLKESNA